MSTTTILFSNPKRKPLCSHSLFIVLVNVFKLLLHVYVSIYIMKYCFAHFLVLSENFMVHFIHSNTCFWNFSMLVYITQYVRVWLGTQNESRYSKQKGIWYTELEVSITVGRLGGTMAKRVVSDHYVACTTLCAWT